MDFVLICRLSIYHVWRIVNNPDFDNDFEEGLLIKLMQNYANEYAEFCNCGVIYRLIRKEDSEKYF